MNESIETLLKISGFFAFAILLSIGIRVNTIWTFFIVGSGCLALGIWNWNRESKIKAITEKKNG